MKVYDMNNGKWYHKGKLIQESYEVFLKDLDINCFDNERDMKKEAMNTAKEYVAENTLATLKEVNEWREKNE